MTAVLCGMRWLSLCSGIGGFDLGIENSDHRHIVVAAAETSEKAWQCYASHFWRPENFGDVLKLEPSTLPKTIHAVCAGFPCQPFSLAGKRLGTADSRGTLAFAIIGIAQQVGARYILLENVPGLLSSAGGKDFFALLMALDENGYDAEWQVLDGHNFRPQHRERLFIVGRLRAERTRPILPVAAPHRDADGARRAPPTRRKRIRPAYSGTIDANYGKAHGARTFIASPYGPCRVQNADHPDARAPTLKTATGGATATGLVAVSFNANQRDANGKPWHVDKTPTVLSVPHIGVVDGEKAIRRMTPLECERLQGFPDHWTALPGFSDTARYNLIGAAVMPPVVEWLARRFPAATQHRSFD